MTFFTEVAILIALAQGGLGWVAGAAVVLLLGVFAGLARHLLAMTMGGSDVPPSPATPARLRRTLPLALALGAAAVLGFVAMPLSGVLTDAVAALTGGR